MRRLVVVVVVAVGIAGVWWLAEDGEVGNRLSAFGERILNRATGEPPSWGDVADRVGDFASEERELKQTVGALGAGPDEAEAADNGANAERNDP